MVYIETAKDGNETAYYVKYGKKKYIYSMYEPRVKIKIPEYKYDNDLLILGYGLGYEVDEILKKAKGKVFIIENNEQFKLRYFKNNYDSRVILLSGHEYLQYSFDKYEIVNLTNITECDQEYYYDVVTHVNSIYKHAARKKVIVMSHTTIARDAAAGFAENGFEVIQLEWIHNDEKQISEILSYDPDFIFTVNFSRKISEISRKFGIYYIAWVVDTPCYPIYEQNMYHDRAFVFIYDRAIAEKLKEKIEGNIFYLPAGAPVHRIEAGTNSEKNIDVSFVGTTGIESEYNQYLKDKITNKTLNRIIEMFSKQLQSETYILDTLIDQDLIKTISYEADYYFEVLTALTAREKLGFILGRKYNEIERKKMIEVAAKDSKCCVYGDSSWLKYDIPGMVYNGEAEHYKEMPEVFKRSKINLNLTRVYVEDGLPMRVFDVLAAGGFLLTNYRPELEKYFEIGKEIDVFHNFDDLTMKIRYYLKNDSVREKIAAQGQKKVIEEHGYDKRVKEIITIVEQHCIAKAKETLHK